MILLGAFRGSAGGVETAAWITTAIHLARILRIGTQTCMESQTWKLHRVYHQVLPAGPQYAVLWSMMMTAISRLLCLLPGIHDTLRRAGIHIYIYFRCMHVQWANRAREGPNSNLVPQIVEVQEQDPKGDEVLLLFWQHIVF